MFVLANKSATGYFQGIAGLKNAILTSVVTESYMGEAVPTVYFNLEAKLLQSVHHLTVHSKHCFLNGYKKLQKC